MNSPLDIALGRGKNGGGKMNFVGYYNTHRTMHKKDNSGGRSSHIYTPPSTLLKTV